MDAAAVRAMLEQHFASGDPELSHEMYHDDAVSSSYSPASASSELTTSATGGATIRRTRALSSGRSEADKTSGSLRSRSATTRVLRTSGSASSNFEATRSRVSRSTSPRAGTH